MYEQNRVNFRRGMLTIFPSMLQRTLMSMSEEKGDPMFMETILKFKPWLRCIADPFIFTVIVLVSAASNSFVLKLLAILNHNMQSMLSKKVGNKLPFSKSWFGICFELHNEKYLGSLRLSLCNVMRFWDFMQFQSPSTFSNTYHSQSQKWASPWDCATIEVSTTTVLLIQIMPVLASALGFQASSLALMTRTLSGNTTNKCKKPSQKGIQWRVNPAYKTTTLKPRSEGR